MKKPPAIKMSLPSTMLLFLLFVSLSLSLAAPSPEPANYADDGGVAPPSSIYAYTITNPNKLQQTKEQQQQQLVTNDISYNSNSNNFNNKNNNLNNNNNNNNVKNNNKNNKNLINYTTNTATNYRSGNSNRNYYYTATANNNNNNNNINNKNNNNNNNNNNNINNNNIKSKDIYRTSSSSSSSLSSSSSASASTSTTAFGSSPAPPGPVNGCSLDRLAVYKVVLHTYWTRELFPKHYPDWRPTAQWTKTIGRTHDSNYALYHIGQQATPGVKQFAETGKSDMLDSMAAQQLQQQQQSQSQQGNSFTSFVPATGAATKSETSQQQQQQTPLLQHGERSVFDEFAIPAITTGAGRSEAKFFVDSNHSLVSLMTRIVPSPDWFIGVDSFQLCVGGSWIDTVTVEMDPLDAGTDNGFTFTAPNWPTSPQGVIYRITSRYPAHPAGSFFYPKSKRLPPMATFQFIKLKEYELSEVFNFAEDDRKYETVQTQTHLESEHNHVEMNNELSASIERERQNEVTPGPTSVTERDRIRSQLLAKMNPMNNASSPSVVPKNDKDAIIDDIVQNYQKRREGSNANGGTTRPRSTTTRRRQRSRDCRVSHWSEWSACSKTCGIGEMHRYRKVIKHGRRGGRPCPALQESKWCGSEKGCHKTATYFNWSNT